MIGDTPISVILSWALLVGTLGLLMVIVATPSMQLG